MPLSRLVTLLLDRQFLRYIIASVGALSVDVGTFMLLVREGVAAGPAAALGYSIGMLANWWLVSRGVFDTTLAEKGEARLRQQVLFVVTTLAGLGLTTAIVGGLVAAGLAPIVTKGFAVVVSFFLNWGARKYLVFGTGRTF